MNSNNQDYISISLNKRAWWSVIVFFYLIVLVASSYYLSHANTKISSNQNNPESISPAADESEDFHIQQSLKFYNEKKYPECIEECKKILKMNPNNETAYNNLCAAYIGLGKYEEAKEACAHSFKH